VTYITDTHAPLWHLYWPQRLGKVARRVFSDEDAGQVCIRVPAVVVAETLLVVQKGCLPGASFSTTYYHTFVKRVLPTQLHVFSRRFNAWRAKSWKEPERVV
jgi:PIN domain nuclease of toxin-antitoxin system